MIINSQKHQQLVEITDHEVILTPEEKTALRAVLAHRPFASVEVRIDNDLCYRYQNDPFAQRGTAVRSPGPGRVVWRVGPGPVEDGAHLGDVVMSGTAHPVRAPGSGRLSRPLIPQGASADYLAALAVIYDDD